MLKIKDEDPIILQKKCYKFTDKIIKNKLFNIPMDVMCIVFEYCFIGDIISFLFTCKFLLERHYNLEYFYGLAKNKLNINKEDLIRQLVKNKIATNQLREKSKLNKRFYKTSTNQLREKSKLNKKIYKTTISLKFLRKYTKNIYSYLYSLLAFPEYYLAIIKYVKKYSIDINIIFNLKYCRTPYFHDLSFLIPNKSDHNYTSSIKIIFDKKTNIGKKVSSYIVRQPGKKEKTFLRDVKKANNIDNLKKILLTHYAEYKKELDDLIIRVRDIIRIKYFDIYIRKNNVFLINDTATILRDTKPESGIYFYQYYQGLSELINDEVSDSDSDLDSDSDSD